MSGASRDGAPARGAATPHGASSDARAATPDASGELPDAASAIGGAATHARRERLAEVLLEDGPVRVVSIGERARARLDAVAPSPSVERGLHFDTLGDCAGASALERRSDTALFAPDSLDALDRALGLACRLFPERLLVLFEAPSLPAPERLLAFGFRRVFADGGSVLHEYRLRDYKPSPEWLNARFWAHPERFGADAGDGDAEAYDPEEEEDEEESLDDTVDD